MVDEMNTRIHIRDEIVNQLVFEDNKMKEKKRHIYLYNDLLVITQPQKKKNEKFIEKYNKKKIRIVSQVDSTDEIPPHTIKIIFRDKSDILISFNVGGSVINWMNELAPKSATPRSDRTERPNSGRNIVKKDSRNDVRNDVRKDVRKDVSRGNERKKDKESTSKDGSKESKRNRNDSESSSKDGSNFSKETKKKLEVIEILI